MGGRPLTEAGHPGYAVRRLPRDRLIVLDMLRGAGRRFPVHALVEFDVEQASVLIRESNERVTWTGFVLAAIARAVAIHPEVNARRAGNRIVLYDRIDVGATMERQVDGAIVLGTVAIRDADRKTPAAISEELHRAKAGDAGPPPSRPGLTTRLWRLPGPIRRAAFRIAGSRPGIAATFGPAVGVTSLGMFADGGGWAVPIPPLTVIATIGGVVDRAVVRDGRIVARPMLPLTLSFDHGVIDGAPAARFASTLRDLIETASVFDVAAARDR